MKKQFTRAVKFVIRTVSYRLSWMFEWVMSRHIAERRKEVILSSPGNHVFFGYYDVSPFAADGKRVLAGRVDLALKTPAPHRVMEVGYYQLDKPDEFRGIGQTTAWCWQQGCRLQWYPATGVTRQVFYNQASGSDYVGVVQDVETGQIVMTTPLPLYEISKDGKWGLSLDFARLQRLRPGYGYSVFEDGTAAQPVPQQGGIVLYNFASNQQSLVVSYSALFEFSPVESMQGAEHYINHLSFNPSGAAFIFLHLWVRDGKRYSRLLWVDRGSAKLVILNNSGRVSHYTWRDDQTLLIYCALTADGPLFYHEYLLRGDQFEVKAVGKNVLKVDGHPSYFNAQHRFLTDTYPDRWARQTLMIYDGAVNAVVWSRSFFRSKHITGEFRADLHPRLDSTQKYACIDDEIRGERVMRIVTFGESV